MHGNWRMQFDLADAPQRLHQNAPLCCELRVESQRRPVASPALFSDRTRLCATQRTGSDQPDEVCAREPLLHIAQTNDGDVAGIKIRGKDRKSIHARERRTARNELGWLNGDLISDLVQISPRCRSTSI